MLFNYLLDKMIEDDVIPEEEREVYLYGLNQGMTILQNIFVTLIIGAIFGNLIATGVFLIIYIPLRSFAGGYHAATAKRCFFYSVFLVLGIQLYFGYLFEETSRYVFITVVISSFIIYINSPLQSVRKPLSEEERLHYKKLIGVIVVIGSCVLYFAEVLRCLTVIKGIAIAFYVETMLLLLGKVKS